MVVVLGDDLGLTQEHMQKASEECSRVNRSFLLTPGLTRPDLPSPTTATTADTTADGRTETGRGSKQRCLFFEVSVGPTMLLGILHYAP